MNVDIDGSIKEIDSLSDVTLEQLIKDIRQDLSKLNRTILTFILDGEELSSERQAELAQTRVNNYKELKVFTIDTRDTALTVLKEFRDQLDKLDETKKLVHLALSMGDTNKALRSLELCFNFWKAMVKGLDYITVLREIDLAKLPVDGKPGSEILQELLESLGKFNRAFQKSDIVQMGDITQFELRTLIPKWKRLLEVIIERVESQ